MKENKKQIWQEDLEETVLRIHVELRRLEIRYKYFAKIKEKIEKPRISLMTKKDKIQLSEWGEYRFYQGKMYAYFYFLERLGLNDAPDLIKRLRGIEYSKDEAKSYQTKFV